MSQEMVTVVFRNGKKVEIPRANLGNTKRIFAGQIEYIAEKEGAPIIARPVVEVVAESVGESSEEKPTASMSNTKDELTEMAKDIEGYNPKMNKQQLVDLIND